MLPMQPLGTQVRVVVVKMGSKVKRLHEGELHFTPQYGFFVWDSIETFKRTGSQSMGNIPDGAPVIVLGEQWEEYVRVATSLGPGWIHESAFFAAKNETP